MTNPFTIIRNINVRLSVQEINDAGSGTVVSAVTGLFVAFNKTFVDVRSITVTAATNPSYPDGVIGQYTFGTEADGGFTAHLFRRDTGAEVTGSFSWAARGV